MSEQNTANTAKQVEALLGRITPNKRLTQPKKTEKDFIILFDMDGVIADWQKMFDELIAKHIPEVEVITPDKLEQYHAQDLYPEEYRPRIRELMMLPGFYRDLEPLVGAIESVNRLAEKYTAFFCSAPFNGHETCASEKVAWIREMFGFDWEDKIILTNDKTLVQGDIIIDDKPVIHGAIEDPAWVHIVYSHNYNRNIYPRIESWDEIDDIVDNLVSNILYNTDNTRTEAMV